MDDVAKRARVDFAGTRPPMLTTSIATRSRTPDNALTHRTRTLRTTALAAVVSMMTTLGVACGGATPRTAGSGTAAGSSGGHQHAEKGSDWAYSGKKGPRSWGMLSNAYADCGRGQYQSPIDLHEAARGSSDGIEFHYQHAPLDILDNGHTVQVIHPGAGSFLSLKGHGYLLQQFHFHSPSEHAVDGKRHAIEAHFVHKDQAGNIAVVAVFIDPGEEKPALSKVLGHLPRGPGDELRLADVDVDPTQLLPTEGDVYRYFGSLTTPPCTERVFWTVFREPIYASPEHIEAFRNHYRANARPLQPRPDWCLFPGQAPERSAALER